MATTYYQRDTNSDLAVPTLGRFYKQLLTGTAAAGTITSGAIAGSAIVQGYAYTDVGVPGAVGAVSGTYTVEMNVTIASTTCNVTCAIRHVSSTGTVKNQTSFAAAVASSPARVIPFSFTPTTWTWATGDRLLVVYEYRRTSSMGNETVIIGANTTNEEITAPWTIIPSFEGALNVTQAANTLAASGTFTAAGSTGTVAATQADQTLSATGVLRYTGTLAVSQADQTLSAAGTFTPAPITGTLAATQANQTLSAAGLVAGPQQIIRPTATTLAGGWTAVGAATLHAAVAETVASFDEHIRSENNPAVSPVVLRLGTLSEPSGVVADGDVAVRVQYDKEGAATAALVVQLRQGYVSEGSPGTLIASTSDSNITDAAEDITLALTAAEHDAVTYTGGAASNLDVRITADVT